MATIQGGYDDNRLANQAALKRVTLTDTAGNKTGADSTMYGYDLTNTTWRPLRVNSNGELITSFS